MAAVPPAPAPEMAKSDASTRTTFSLKVTVKVTLVALVASEVGVFLTMLVTVGASLSNVMLVTLAVVALLPAASVPSNDMV